MSQVMRKGRNGSLTMMVMVMVTESESPPLLLKKFIHIYILQRTRRRSWGRVVLAARGFCRVIARSYVRVDLCASRRVSTLGMQGRRDDVPACAVALCTSRRHRAAALG